jgi:hypothetical protein
MRDMKMIPDKQLERVAARRQGNHHFRLTVPEMDVIVIRGNGATGVDGIDIDQEMVVAGARLDDARGRYAHAAHPELSDEALRNADAIDGIMEIRFRALRRWGARLNRPGGRRFGALMLMLLP